MDLGLCRIWSASRIEQIAQPEHETTRLTQSQLHATAGDRRSGSVKCAHLAGITDHPGYQIREWSVSGNAQDGLSQPGVTRHIVQGRPGFVGQPHLGMLSCEVPGSAGWHPSAKMGETYAREQRKRHDAGSKFANPAAD
jgi:hypothetical protein